MNDTSEMLCRVHVLAVSPFASDHTTLKHIFSHSTWSLDSALSLREAKSKLFDPASTAVAPVILCEEQLPDGAWKDMLALSQSVADPFHLIVTSQYADDRLWAEVLNLGAYDVLAKPFHSKEIFRTIGLAWRHWMDSRKSATCAFAYASRSVAAGVA